MTRGELLALAIEIAKKKHELALLEARFLRLANHAEVTAATAALVRAIVAHLALLGPGASMGAREAAGLLGGYALPTARAALSKLAGRGERVRVAHGRYALPS